VIVIHDLEVSRKAHNAVGTSLLEVYAKTVNELIHLAHRYNNTGCLFFTIDSGGELSVAD